jgi:hypothetical protein
LPTGKIGDELSLRASITGDIGLQRRLRARGLLPGVKACADPSPA